MGGDGGVKGTDRRFIRGTKDADEKVAEGRNIIQNQELKSRTCAQSKEPLQYPIVACELGNLYNKEDIIKALINKTLCPAFSHIRGLKDLKTVEFTFNPLDKKDHESACKYCCPISSTEFNGLNPFVLIWTNGQVVSEKGIREMGGIEHLQAECGPFTDMDLVRLLPLTGEECVLQVERMEKRRKAQKANAIAAKSKREEVSKREPNHEGKGYNAVPAIHSIVYNSNSVGSCSAGTDKTKRVLIFTKCWEKVYAMTNANASVWNCCRGADGKSDELLSCVESVSDKGNDDMNVFLISFATNNIQSYAAYSFFVNTAYAHAHGYQIALFKPCHSDFVNNCVDGVVEDARWMKIKVLHNELTSGSISAENDFVVWMDSDLIILDMSFDLRLLVHKVMVKYPNAHIIISKESYRTNGVANTGMMIVRRSSWSIEFLSKWWNRTDHSNAMDQHVLTEMYNHDVLRCQSAHHVALLRSDVLNSHYPAWKFQQPHHQVLHLVGASSVYRREVFLFAMNQLCSSVTLTHSTTLPLFELVVDQLGLTQQKLQHIQQIELPQMTHRRLVFLVQKHQICVEGLQNWDDGSDANIYDKTPSTPKPSIENINKVADELRDLIQMSEENNEGFEEKGGEVLNYTDFAGNWASASDIREESRQMIKWSLWWCYVHLVRITVLRIPALDICNDLINTSTLSTTTLNHTFYCVYSVYSLDYASPSVANLLQLTISAGFDYLTYNAESGGGRSGNVDSEEKYPQFRSCNANRKVDTMQRMGIMVEFLLQFFPGASTDAQQSAPVPVRAVSKQRQIVLYFSFKQVEYLGFHLAARESIGSKEYLIQLLWMGVGRWFELHQVQWYGTGNSMGEDPLMEGRRLVLLLADTLCSHAESEYDKDTEEQSFEPVVSHSTIVNAYHGFYLLLETVHLLDLSHNSSSAVKSTGNRLGDNSIYVEMLQEYLWKAARCSRMLRHLLPLLSVEGEVDLVASLPSYITEHWIAGCTDTVCEGEGGIEGRVYASLHPLVERVLRRLLSVLNRQYQMDGCFHEVFPKDNDIEERTSYMKDNDGLLKELIDISVGWHVLLCGGSVQVGSGGQVASPHIDQGAARRKKKVWRRKVAE